MCNLNPILTLSDNNINGIDMDKNNTNKLNALKDAMSEVRSVLIKYGIKELEGKDISFKDGTLNLSNSNIIIEENTSGNEDENMNDKLNLKLRSDCLEELSEMINNNILEGLRENRSLLEVDIREIYNSNDIDNEYEANLNFVKEVNKDGE
jgi:hypothetical protein